MEVLTDYDFGTDFKVQLWKYQNCLLAIKFVSMQMRSIVLLALRDKYWGRVKEFVLNPGFTFLLEYS